MTLNPALPPAASPKRRAADVAYDAIEAMICTLQLQPGSVGFLKAGTATTWTVRRTLRKIYIARA